MPDDQPDHPLMDRELSWLSFSHRVLQEARDASVPLFERLFFCGIFSSNLDEFFRVRVASLRSLLRLGAKDHGRLGLNPHRLLHDIHRTVLAQQEEYGQILGGLMDELRREGVRLVDNHTVGEEHHEWLRDYFRTEVHEHLTAVPLESDDGGIPFLENQGVYLVVELWPEDSSTLTTWRPSYSLVEVPCPPLGRFVTLPGSDGDAQVMFLDDVIRFNLEAVFPNRGIGRSYAVKLTRDADLHVEDEFDGDLVDAIRKSLSKRDTGVPSRFLYDGKAPYVLIHSLQHALALVDEDLVLGAVYQLYHF